MNGKLLAVAAIGAVGYATTQASGPSDGADSESEATIGAGTPERNARQNPFSEALTDVGGTDAREATDGTVAQTSSISDAQAEEGSALREEGVDVDRNVFSTADHSEEVSTDTAASAASADPGDSQNFGNLSEAENDDLTDRAAESNMSDRVKSAFDTFANRDKEGP